MRELRYLFVLLAFMGIFTAPARAQPSLQASSCMPAVMTVIEKRGLLEAQREVIQNQNLIAKPDSLLEYSCFEQHVALSGRVAGQMFSEAEWFFNVDDPMIDQFSLDRALYTLVFESLVAYLRANFWHRYLGDRSDLTALPDPGSGNFTCYAMSYVWNRAACGNFIAPREAQDGFYTFAEYQQIEDPRNLPVPQSCPRWPQWQATITDSNRMNAPLSTAAGPNRPRQDPLVLYRDLFDPDNCAPPVPTGLYMTPYRGAGIAGFDEYSCITPGCRYNGSNCVRG